MNIIVLLQKNYIKIQLYGFFALFLMYMVSILKEKIFVCLKET
uniref:Uncharacterized protein n=1 Tax=Bacteriophage sp. TaxID=38018 RepID=A0A8D9PEP3_9VIRU|nr:MAG TPA: hypothetical protein [Bacteriophage sp.]